MADDQQTSVWQLVREDFRTHRHNPAATGMQALVLHRLSRAAHESRSPVARAARPLCRAAWMLVKGLYNVELPHTARIGRRVRIPHPHSVVVVEGAVVGDDCLLRHNVTLGAGTGDGGAPVIGDRVEFGPGAMVIGSVTVGDDVLVGPGALVMQDVPAGSRVLAPLATIRPPRSRRKGDRVRRAG